MARMTRRQIYIQERQNRMLKRLARASGLSEAGVIRQAIERHIHTGCQSARPDPEAWERARDFMLSLHARGPLRGRKRDWKREDLYEERLSRYDRRAR